MSTASGMSAKYSLIFSTSCAGTPDMSYVSSASASLMTLSERSDSLMQCTASALKDRLDFFEASMPLARARRKTSCLPDAPDTRSTHLNKSGFLSTSFGTMPYVRWLTTWWRSSPRIAGETIR